MRKLSFFPRLALTNLFRNRDTYLPYLLACTVCVFTFYTLCSINMNDGVMAMRGDVYIKSFTAIGSVILAIFCTILLFYTNSFLIKRRKKELGLYSILGMEKGNIGVVMFFETLFTGLISLVIGLGLGMLLARLLYLGLLRLVRFPITFDLPVSLPAAGITAAFFSAIFLLTLLANLRQVKKADPVQLLAGAKEGEKEPKSSLLITLVGLVCLVAGYVIALRVSNAVEALMLFLLAAFLVIIGTFCLFTSGSIAVLKMLRRNKNYYYTPKHFIPVSGMIYRMKQNAAGLAAICILSCMVLVTVSATVSLYSGVEDSLYNQYPHEFEAKCDNGVDAPIMQAGIDALTERHNLTITGLKLAHTLNIAAYGDGLEYNSAVDYYNNSTITTSFSLMPLEDYNAMEGKNVQLAPGEALVFSTGIRYEQPSVTLNGIHYDLSRIDTLDGRDFGSADISPSILLVVPGYDDLVAANNAQPEQARSPEDRLTSAQFLFDTEGSEADKEAFYSDLVTYAIDTPSQDIFHLTSREKEREGWYMANGGFLFLGIYFGALFLMAAAMIIYYKQISEGYDDRERYIILQKVGMSGDEVRKTIGSQIRTVFMLPLLIAMVHIVVATTTISKALVVFGIFNPMVLVVSTIVTVAIYALIYALVYRRTARSYYKIVRFAA